MKFIPTTSTSAAFHFALEEYLMNSNTYTSDYFMLWRTNPTVMIGRYQNTLDEINQQYAKDSDLTIVRRNTGGGTIYTDMGGWQFSFITHKDGRGFQDFIKPVIDALAKLGVDAEFTGRNDIIVKGKKFSGNAKWITDHRMLHHGSILYDTNIENLVRSLNVSEEKYISKGIKSVKERVINIKPLMITVADSQDFGKQLIDIISKEMPLQSLTDEDYIEVEKLKKEKFENWDWNYGKSPEFNFSEQQRFTGGMLKVSLDVKKGHIVNCVVNGDFFTNRSIDILSQGLLGIKYEKEEIMKFLLSISADTLIIGINQDEILSCIIK